MSEIREDNSPAALLPTSCLHFCLPRSSKQWLRLWEDSRPNHSESLLPSARRSPSCCASAAACVTLH